MRYLFFCLLIFYPSIVQAIEFSEIAYDIVGSDDGHEWLELHNETDQSVDLTGYYFADSANHTLTLPPGKGGQGSLVLPAGGYLILADDAALFLTDHPGYSGTVIDTTMSLSNYSSTRTEPISISLLDTQKNPISQAAFLPTNKGEKGYTLELDPSLIWSDSQRPGGSPGTVRPLPVPPMPLPEVHLSEIVSNPDGADAGAEVVELHNRGSQPVKLEGWYIADRPTESGSLNRHTIVNSTIETGAYLAITLKGSFLNNKDEEVSLYTDDDRLVESIFLSGDAKEGQSYALIDGGWQWTATLTLGFANSFSQPGSTTSSSKTTASEPTKTATTAKSSSQAQPPTPTKRTTNATVSPSASSRPSPHDTNTPRSLPTQLATVAGITTTESPSALAQYLVIFLPPLTLIGGLAFYLYKKKLLFFKPRPP